MARSTGIRFVFRALCSLALTAAAVFSVTKFARAEVDPVPLLQQALRTRLTIWTNKRTGFMKPASHCRSAQGGCDARLLEFAQYLKDAGERFEIDPWLLAAMAYRESRLNPFAVGKVGERGILQLHPKNKRSKHVRFVTDSHYRAHCKRETGACQREVVERAAQMLATSLNKCGGDLEQALAMYNTGRCSGGHRYADRVLRERARLKQTVGLDLEGLTASNLQVHASTVSQAQADGLDAEN
ncbi:MAG: hypothetical protein RL701_2963 [Pseudomonadota bacterium]|jgi:hypothetical protein